MTYSPAFSSDHPTVLDAWNEYRDRTTDVHEERTAIEDRIGLRLMVRTMWGHGSQAIGFAYPEHRDEMTEDRMKDLGLRTEKASHYLVPRRASKGGKALAIELHDLSLQALKLPGMPSWVFVGLRCCGPALFEDDGTVWARWGDDVETSRDDDNQPRPAIDLDLWTPRPLSAFYAAREVVDA